MISIKNSDHNIKALYTWRVFILFFHLSFLVTIRVLIFNEIREQIWIYLAVFSEMRLLPLIVKNKNKTVCKIT